MKKSEENFAEELNVEDLMALLNRNHLPKHIAIIMDGNGRWAEKRGLPRIAGHQEGIHSVREMVTLSRELDIGALTIYAFSLENWKRPSQEIHELMVLLEEYLEKELETMMEHSIRFKTIGRMERLPETVRGCLARVEEETSHNDKMTLTIALSYGGRTEIVDAARALMKECLEGRMKLEDIEEEEFSLFLGTRGMVDPDLMIRTSGEARISNFLLWQLAYTELYFTETLWPDFRRRDFLLALLDYQQRERRFGLVSDQIHGRK
ncbi:MAG TPA: isoprenyl transferase [Nitrospiria bacterium]|jgi:undecaprenyl diphosphate synthase